MPVSEDPTTEPTDAQIVATSQRDPTQFALIFDRHYAVLALWEMAASGGMRHLRRERSRRRAGVSAKATGMTRAGVRAR